MHLTKPVACRDKPDHDIHVVMWKNDLEREEPTIYINAARAAGPDVGSVPIEDARWLAQEIERLLGSVR